MCYTCLLLLLFYASRQVYTNYGIVSWRGLAASAATPLSTEQTGADLLRWHKIFQFPATRPEPTLPSRAVECRCCNHSLLSFLPNDYLSMLTKPVSCGD